MPVEQPVEQRADPRDKPRRACLHCQTPLPVSMDTLDACVLSIAGLNRAGKTYFLGSTLYAATRNDALQPYGVRSITPLSDTAQRLHRDYAQPLFKNHSLDFTTRYAHVEREPLIFKVTMESGAAFVLVTHDVSGEALMSDNDRAVTAGFVRRSDALIFLADPTDMTAVKRHLPDGIAEEHGLRDLNQSALLDVILDELSPAHRRTTPPLALAVSKSDLISDYAQRDYLFARHTNLARWQDDCRQVHHEVRNLLLELGEQSLVRLTDRLGSSTFHAVSVLGPRDVRAGNGGRPAPARVLNPLGVVLNKIALKVTAPGGS